jgi:hypothetical protein
MLLQQTGTTTVFSVGTSIKSAVESESRLCRSCPYACRAGQIGLGQVHLQQGSGSEGTALREVLKERIANLPTGRTLGLRCGLPDFLVLGAQKVGCLPFIYFKAVTFRHKDLCCDLQG